jgi:hypothetical protein
MPASDSAAKAIEVARALAGLYVTDPNWTEDEVVEYAVDMILEAQREGVSLEAIICAQAGFTALVLQVLLDGDRDKMDAAIRLACEVVGYAQASDR